MADDKTKNYYLRTGRTHTHNGERVKPGDAVPLTDAQYAAFRDKFAESVGEAAASSSRPSNVHEVQDAGGAHPDPSKGPPSGGPGAGAMPGTVAK